MRRGGRSKDYMLLSSAKCTTEFRSLENASPQDKLRRGTGEEQGLLAAERYVCTVCTAESHSLENTTPKGGDSLTTPAGGKTTAVCTPTRLESSQTLRRYRVGWVHLQRGGNTKPGEQLILLRGPVAPGRRQGATAKEKTSELHSYATALKQAVHTLLLLNRSYIRYCSQTGRTYATAL